MTNSKDYLPPENLPIFEPTKTGGDFVENVKKIESTERGSHKTKIPDEAMEVLKEDLGNGKPSFVKGSGEAKKKKKKLVSEKGEQVINEMFLVGGGVVVCLLFLLTFGIFFAREMVIFQMAGALLSNFWWLILPPTFWMIFFALWGEYSVVTWIMKQKRVILEIVPPSDTERSPKIMEQLFTALHNFSTPNKFEVFCGWRPLQDKMSVEIASTDGKVHFYIWCNVMARDQVESQIYAQYPDAEVFEVEDYSKITVPQNLPNKDWDLWGSVMCLIQNPALPIRTYKHFQEEVTGKMIDPLASLTEAMGKTGPGQHIWFQIIFRPILENSWQPDFKEYIEKEIMKKKEPAKKKIPILGAEALQEFLVMPMNIAKGFLGQDLAAPPEGGDPGSDESVEDFNINRLPPGEQEKLKAIHDYMGRPFFHTAFRFAYIGKRDNFNKGLGVSGPLGAIKQFSESNLNSIVVNNDTKTFANYFFTKSRMIYRQRKIVQGYRDRDAVATWVPFSSEGLASLFHFPDTSVKAGSFDRIEAKKGLAPRNLPVE